MSDEPLSAIATMRDALISLRDALAESHVPARIQNRDKTSMHLRLGRTSIRVTCRTNPATAHTTWSYWLADNAIGPITRPEQAVPTIKGAYCNAPAK